MLERAPGIPTYFEGTRYRSRLEARWACLMTWLRWPFMYEPLELEGYLPDFLIGPGLTSPGAPACAREVGTSWSLIAEVRPSLGEAWAADARDKIAASGWTACSVVLGSIMEVDADGRLGAGGALWGHCGACVGTTLAIVTEALTCLRCGSLALSLAPGAPGIAALWAEAGNAVQWRAPAAPCPTCAMPDADFPHRLACRPGAYAQ